MRRATFLLLPLAFITARAFAQPTYSREVSRIMQAKCQQCHRPGDVAPMSLLTYDDGVTWANDIKRVVAAKQMPPWKPVPGFNEFKGSYGLSDEDRQMILDWIEAGTPAGDPGDMPDPVSVSDSPWNLGDPDMILTMPEYTPPRAADTYRCFVLPSGLDQSRFVSAVQTLPGAKQEVHHVVLFLDTRGEADKLDGQDGQPGYTCFGGPGINLDIGGVFSGWAPGARTRRLPDGIGLLLPAKSRLILQVHYHPAGRVSPDQTQVGLYFAPADVSQKRLINVPLVNMTFRIPAGAQDYEVRASLPIPPFFAANAITVFPHMHLLGRRIKLEVEDLDGKRRPMIYIDDWDFNWQGFYEFAEPVRLPVGSTLRLTTNYDNSENNPKNPNNPLKPVGWGEGTNDEMCLAFIGVVLDNDVALFLNAIR